MTVVETENIVISLVQKLCRSFNDIRILEPGITGNSIHKVVYFNQPCCSPFSRTTKLNSVNGIMDRYKTVNYDYCKSQNACEAKSILKFQTVECKHQGVVVVN